MLKGLLGRLGLESRKRAATPIDYFQKLFFQAGASPITDSRSVPAVWAMLDLIATSIAALPVVVYRRGDDGLETPDRTHLANDLLAEPDAGWNRFEAFEYWIAEAARLGTSYLRVLRAPNGQPIGWYPLLTAAVQPQLAESGRLFFRVTRQVGIVGAPANELLTADDVAVLRYRMSDDGYRGLNPSWFQSRAIATGYAQLGQDESFAARGLRHGGIISLDGKAQPDTLQALRQQWETVFADPTAGKVAVLDQGAKFSGMNLSPRDSEWFDTRNLGIQEMARIYGVPPSAIGEVSRATYSNVEEQQRQVVRQAIMPWLHRASAALTRAFLSADERRGYRIGFDDAGLVRGNLKDRSEYLSRLVGSGVLTRNEARFVENLPPVPGGDAVLTPLNLSTDPSATRSALETRELPVAVRDRLRIRATFEPRFAAALEELLEAELERLRQIMTEDAATARLEELYEQEIRRQLFPNTFMPIALQAVPAVRQAVLKELAETVAETDPSVRLDDFVKAVIEAQARQFAALRRAEAELVLQLPDAERAAALDDMRASPPRSAQHMTIRTTESFVTKLYQKRGRQRLKLVAPDGEVLRSIDVQRPGGLVAATDAVLKHAPTRRFPDALLIDNFTSSFSL